MGPQPVDACPPCDCKTFRSASSPAPGAETTECMRLGDVIVDAYMHTTRTAVILKSRHCCVTQFSAVLFRHICCAGTTCHCCDTHMRLPCTVITLGKSAASTSPAASAQGGALPSHAPRWQVPRRQRASSTCTSVRAERFESAPEQDRIRHGVDHPYAPCYNMELEQPADSSDSFQEWLKCQFDDPHPLTDTGSWGVDGQAAARLYREQLQGVPAEARQHWRAKNGVSLQSDSVPGHVVQPQCADSELQPCSTASAPTAAPHSVPKSSSVDHATGSAARTQLQGGDQQEPLPQNQLQRQKRQQQTQPRQAPERKNTTQHRGPGGHGRRTMVGTWHPPAVQFHTLCPSPWPLTQQCSAPPALPGSHALTQPWVHSRPLSSAISSMQQHIWWATQGHGRLMSASCMVWGLHDQHQHLVWTRHHPSHVSSTTTIIHTEHHRTLHQQHHPPRSTGG